MVNTVLVLVPEATVHQLPGNLVEVPKISLQTQARIVTRVVPETPPCFLGSCAIPIGCLPTTPCPIPGTLRLPRTRDIVRTTATLR